MASIIFQVREILNIQETIMEQSLCSPHVLRERNKLVLELNKGEFWKPCPGTAAGYLCCGYQIISPLTGCGMYCTYCVLQVYFDHHHQVAFRNFKDLESEVHQKMETWGPGVVRFGTGEFADSLYLEPRLRLCEKISALLEPYPNAIVEFKTKSNHVDTLSAIRNPRKVIIGFSLNTPRNIGLFESNTASLEKRLEAAKRCADMGFWLAFHFDPMIWYPEWKDDYLRVVDQVFSSVKDSVSIAWWSMGGLRTTPALRRELEEQHRHLPLFSGEMILGEDGKIRYFRPIRTAFYRAVQERITGYSPHVPLYLCMESRDIWDEAGMMFRIPRGLPAYLDESAIRMLGK